MTQYVDTIPQDILIGNKLVGRLFLGTFTKLVRGSKHFLRKPPAIAFDIPTLEYVRNHGANIVRVIDNETGKSYVASIETIFKHGFEFNRGYGDQIALEMVYWNNGDDAEQERFGI